MLQNITILAISLALMGTQSAFFAPTKNAVLPQWLHNDELIRGNGLLSGTQFAVILLGTIIGISLATSHPMILAALLFALAIVGWLAAEACPQAPAPNPNLKVDYNPVTAIWDVLKKIFDYPEVLRPWLGIAWFYGLSTIFITAFPNFIANIMGYKESVLQVILVVSTLSIFVGSMFTMAIGHLKIWGPEAIHLVTLGILGVTGFSLLLYFVPEPQFIGAIENELGSAKDFLRDPNTPLFLAAVGGASLFNGMFVVPLQAMAQRRARPEIRAQLMSAGSVLYNFLVNLVTFGLIGLALLSMPPKSPFLMIVAGSAIVAAYAIYRSFKPHHYKTYVS